MKPFIFALLFLLWIPKALAEPSLTVSQLKIIFRAAKRFNIDPKDMVKIAFIESSFNENVKRYNKNRTKDYGMFQINSIHWATTCQKFYIWSLKGNAECAAKLLSNIKRHHSSNDPHWLGRFHSKTPSLKIAYYNKIQSLEFND